MLLYIVMTIRKEIVGTQKVETPEYKTYLHKKAEYDEYESNNNLDWAHGGIIIPPEPKEKYMDEPLYYSIPRVIEYSLQNPTEKYSDRILGQEHPYGDVFIEVIEIENDEIIGHLAMFDKNKNYKLPIITNNIDMK